ncbi:MAG TPA: hypothetical protein VGQ38_11480 [Gaiellaceae bacterium]|nr:hypothetical protein [Gaiellaceae bacterium]
MSESQSGTLNLHINESDGDEVIMPGSPATFEVVAIELTGDDGQQVGRQHIGAPTAVWAGTLVLRLGETYPDQRRGARRPDLLIR